MNVNHATTTQVPMRELGRVRPGQLRTTARRAAFRSTCPTVWIAVARWTLDSAYRSHRSFTRMGGVLLTTTTSPTMTVRPSLRHDRRRNGRSLTACPWTRLSARSARWSTRSRSARSSCRRSSVVTARYERSSASLSPQWRDSRMYPSTRRSLGTVGSARTRR